ncbi:MAG: RCC1 repeat-containing protein, partial [Kofleriaceae bacterium]
MGLRRFAVCVALALIGCSINVDYDGTFYKCGSDGSCPDGYVCKDQVCLPSEPPPPACSTHVTAGRGHSCAVRTDGTVWCWGQNDSGQLGDGTATDSSVPVQARDLAGATAVGAGDGFTCALAGGGSVFCWGRGDQVELGMGTSGARAPSQVPGITGATALAVGETHACVLVGGAVTCWGANDEGELGDGTQTAHGPQNVPGLGTIIQISAGDASTCALDDAGNAKCWGANDSGQLATGDHDRRTTPVAPMGLINNVTEILAGHGYACAATTAGLMACWGDGPLGNGTTTQSDMPVVVANPFPLAHLSAGDETMCGLDAQAQVWCWGRNGDDRIGDGSFQDRA